MRLLLILLTTLVVSGCSAMMVGGGTGGTSASSGSSSSGAADSAVTAAVKSNLAADAAVSSFMIGVRTIGGKVTLTGTVDSYVAYEQAERVAIRSDGVQAIENRIQVKIIE